MEFRDASSLKYINKKILGIEAESSGCFDHVVHGVGKLMVPVSRYQRLDTINKLKSPTKTISDKCDDVDEDVALVRYNNYRPISSQQLKVMSSHCKIYTESIFKLK